MALYEWLPHLKSLWTLWFFLMFVGLMIWTMWPNRRATLEAQARIPLEDDPHSEGADHVR